MQIEAIRKEKIKSNFWYILGIIAIIVFLVWLILDLATDKTKRVITKEYKEASKPIKGQFDMDALEGIKKKAMLNEEQLKALVKYTSNNGENIVIMDGEPFDETNDGEASSSGTPVDEYVLEEAEEATIEAIVEDSSPSGQLEN
jgi:hypothetical protein